MKITWEHVTPICDELFSEVESMYSIQIPDDLKPILKEGNGGAPSKRLFDDEKSKTHEMKTLLSYNRSDMENVYSAFEVLKEIDSKLIPFANDPAGNLICYDGSKVVYWHHETDEIEPIADSISEFFAKLY